MILKRTYLAAMVLLALASLAILYAVGRRIEEIPPFPDAEVDHTVTVDGTTYKLHQGSLYRVQTGSGKWVFVQQVYEPDFYAKNYVERDDTVFRKGNDGQLFPVKRKFSDDFEATSRITKLIGIERGWTSFTLQSPQAPAVNEYVKLRNQLLAGEADFLDNRVEPSGEVVHGGRMALKSVSVSPDRTMVTAKASLSTELLHFVKGDDVWMSLWCHVPVGSGMPFTVLDLETTWLHQHPGMRIVIADGKHACFQLKGFEHPYFRQTPGGEVLFPTGRWVHLKAHLKLTDTDDGVIELWQDGQKIVDARGRTLVLPKTIYNSLEVGISAYNEKGKSATLYVDDVEISDEPLRE